MRRQKTEGGGINELKKEGTTSGWEEDDLPRIITAHANKNTGKERKILGKKNARREGQAPICGKLRGSILVRPSPRGSVQKKEDGPTRDVHKVHPEKKE